jgi:hypothetical protein
MLLHAFKEKSMVTVLENYYFLWVWSFFSRLIIKIFCINKFLIFNINLAATEIVLEARAILPPGKESVVQEKKDLRKYVWSVLNLHFDFLEFVLKQMSAIYGIVRKGGDCGPCK